MTTLYTDTLTPHTNEIILTKKIGTKAWANIDGTGTVNLRDDFGLSSIDDNATGEYDLNFSNTMANDDYYASGISSDISGNPGRYVCSMDNVGIVTTYYEIGVRQTNDGSAQDPEECHAHCNGELA